MTNIVFEDEGQSRARIKVIGVGGGGGNAASAMLATSLAGDVAIYALNTDAQALGSIPDGCECIQIGHKIAGGLGVGADYSKAEEAARQDVDRIDEIIEGADMIFLAAGMGGGTGTGATPFIASRCKEKGILTVAVVTKPFGFENREQNAQIGIENLGQHADSIIIIPNDRIAEVYSDEISVTAMFKHADTILSNAVAGICEIIYRPGHINVDFADVKAVMSEHGQAMMGTAEENGVDRATRVAHAVIECPLLEGIQLSNARGLLVNITADQDQLSLKEINDMMDIIRGTSATGVDVFFGICDNKDCGDTVKITLVATGLRRPGGGPRPRVFDGGGGDNGGGGGAARRPSLIRPNRLSNQGDLLNGGDDKTPAMLRRQHS